MKSVIRKTIVLVLLGAFANLIPPARACGPESIDPIFVFKTSPDLPFTEYARGNPCLIDIPKVRGPRSWLRKPGSDLRWWCSGFAGGVN